MSVAAESASAPLGGPGTVRRTALPEVSQLHAVIEAQRALACAPPDAGVIFAMLAEAACSVLRAEGAVTSQPEGDHLVARATAGSTVVPLGDVIPIAGTLGGLALRSGTAQLCNDGRTDGRTTEHINRRNGTRSSAVVPLVHDGEPIALVAVVSSRAAAFDQRDVELLSMLADIGANRLAYALAHQAQQQLQSQSAALVEVLSEGLVIQDVTGAVSYANPAAERILGVEGLKGRTVAHGAAARMLREDGSPWEPAPLPYAQVLATGLPQRQQAIGVVGADGCVTWLLVHSVPMHDHSGTMTGVLSSFTDVSDRRQAEESLRETTRRLTSAQELTGLASWTWDPVEDRHDWSEQMYLLVGLDPAEEAPDLEGFLALVHPADRDSCRRRCTGRMLTESGEQDLFRVQHPDGTVRYLQAWTTIEHDERGNALLVSGATLDVTARHEAARVLAASEQHFRVAFDNAPIGMSMISLAPESAGQYLRANEQFCTMLGYTADELTSLSMSDLTHEDDVEEDSRRFVELLQGELPGVAFDKRFRRKDGQIVYAWLTSSVAQGPSGEALYLITHTMDVTAQRDQQAELERLALSDTLTGLANRTLLTDRLGQALSRLQRAGGCCALFLLDVDRFKLVNDSLGHQVGDALLVEVAARLRSVSRADSTVARLGGDEFVVLVEGVEHPDDVRAIARRLLATLRRPYTLGEADEPLVSTASIGIALASSGDRSHSDLYREADLALYRAKDGGRDQYALFDAALRARVDTRMESESLLRRALAEDLLTPYFQPIVDLSSGRILAVESLARIDCPERGIVGPADFVDVAEETGLIVELDARMFELGVEQFARWQTDGVRLRRISINVSARSLEDAGFVDRLRRAMACHGVAGDAIRVEITEHSLLAPSPVVVDSLQRIAELGIHLGLDDFGTGYSALAYLQRFDLSFLKIDRSFVSRLGQSDRDDAVVAAVIHLAHAHDLLVVAEGVESQEQLDALREMGCDRAQGFLMGRPVPPAQTVDLLRLDPRW